MEHIVNKLKKNRDESFNKQFTLSDFDNSEINEFDVSYENGIYPVIVSEFWTSKQRQSNRIHEVSYRACFKSQLPSFFIKFFSNPLDVVYDPFNGRGTTCIEAALLNRNIIANDINPISLIFTEPRIDIPDLDEIVERLKNIEYSYDLTSDIDLSMFYDEKTLSEIVSLKRYLSNKKLENLEDNVDKWIRMVATNKLTGHSKYFFSVYTLPPNQAITAKRQIEINKKYNQVPTYKNTKDIIIKKSSELLKNINKSLHNQLKKIATKAVYLNNPADNTPMINNESVDLVITSPPFLDTVDYIGDNWLRIWFNDINPNDVLQKITVTKKVEIWNEYMSNVLKELYRVVKPNGYIAFEVGEVRNGKVKLDENIAKIGIDAGFNVEAVIINQQSFTKTANIWGVSNNKQGTNTNRIVLLKKI